MAERPGHVAGRVAGRVADRVVVIGGGIVGAAVAWHLKVDLAWPGAVTVLERDTGYAHASTFRSAAGLRQQFTTALNIRLSQYGLAFLRARRTPEGAAIAFEENGYLILAGTAEEAAALRKAHATQRAEGADVALLSPAEIAARYPALSVSDLTLGSLGLSGEGWTDPAALHRSLRAGSAAAGVEWVRGEATGLVLGADAIEAVQTPEGAHPADWVVNAAGARAAVVAAWAGVALPVEPRKRTVFQVSCAEPPAGHDRLPLIADPSGLWLRPEGQGFITGKAPDPDPAVSPEDLEAQSDMFDDTIWPCLANRARCFEAARMTGLWAGHYAWNPVDRNAVLGPAPAMPNLLLANGFSGHGLQHAAGVGRALAEWIAHGRYRSLDISALHADRLSRPGPVERAVY